MANLTLKLDTNVFIYAIDTSPNLKEKRQIDRNLIREYIKGVLLRDLDPPPDRRFDAI
jgi:predicted nucleic acid-binding protein